MSVKYSNSPALHLKVGNSRIGQGLQLCFYLCSLLALYLLYARGYPMLSLALAVALCALRMWFSRGAGVGRICWRRGVWAIEQSGELQPVEVCATSTCLPWVIYFAWWERLPRRRGALWLFADSAAPAQLRQLRVRLALQR